MWSNDESDGDVDLSASMNDAIFKPLHDVQNFKSFAVSGHTLSWPNSANFAPEYLQLLPHAATGSLAGNCER